MADTQLIELDTKAFAAIVPWTRVITGGTMLVIANTADPTVQATMLLSVFRSVLADEKIEEFDRLDIFEMIEVCSQWLEKSNAVIEAQQACREPQPKRTFWSRLR